MSLSCVSFLPFVLDPSNSSNNTTALLIVIKAFGTER
jgi:hypothetical protein